MFLIQTQAAERPPVYFFEERGELVVSSTAFVKAGFPRLPVRLGSRNHGTYGLDAAGRPSEIEGAVVQFCIQNGVEGLGELGGDFAVFFDVELREDGLVELTAELLRGFCVSDLEVVGEVERAPQVPEYRSVMVVGVGESLLDVGQLLADALLLGLE